MKAIVTTDYKGLSIVVDSQDQEFSRLTIQNALEGAKMY